LERDIGFLLIGQFLAFGMPETCLSRHRTLKKC
jgi:hypothetical protein